MRLQVRQGDRRARRLQVRGDHLGQGTAIGALQALGDEGSQGAAQDGLAENLARLRNPAAGHVGRGEAGDGLQLGALGGGQLRHALGDRTAPFGIGDGRFQQTGQGHAAAAQAQHLRPARQGARHGVGRQRSTPGHGGETFAAIEVEIGCLCRPPAGVHAHRPAPRVGQDPEAVAADAVHVRIDHRQRRGDGYRRLGRRAAIAQHLQPRFTGKVMGGP